MHEGLPPDGELPPGLVSPAQDGLLRVLYSPDDEVLAEFRRWEAGVALDDLDSGCYRLYPALYHRLRTLAPDHPFLGRMKGLFRRALYRNQLLFRWAREVLGRLRAARIDCIVLKGAALVRSIGFSAGFRPMADVDLLVRPRDARRAMEVADVRFRTVLDDVAATEAHLHLRHGLSVMDEREFEIDLHWRLAGAWAAGEDPDAPFWETAEAIDLQGEPALTLGPTELLYHVLVHGLAWNAVPVVRWVSDALGILEAEGGRVDWGRLVRLAARYRQRPAVRVALSHLVHRFGAPVPPAVLAALAPPYAASELAGFAVRTRPWASPIALEEAMVLTAARLPELERRLPGRRRLVYLPDRMATPRAMAWIRSLGADHLCEFAATAPLMAEARRRIVESAQWQRRFDGAEGALFRLDLFHDVPGGGRTPVYARVGRTEDGKWAIRTFATSLGDWPRGAVVLRLDATMGFLQTSILSLENAMPQPFLPTWPGFVAAAVAPTLPAPPPMVR
ncbi:MAG: nucleotidyltransferase family protein [Alphaproteobacteria bacterium]|nr:nucleotidyltransferase family protein [Alphaproteobacteria bacterium]